MNIIVICIALTSDIVTIANASSLTKNVCSSCVGLTGEELTTCEETLAQIQVEKEAFIRGEIPEELVDVGDCPNSMTYVSIVVKFISISSTSMFIF